MNDTLLELVDFGDATEETKQCSPDHYSADLRTFVTAQPPEPCPVAWMRGFTIYRPGEPDDYDVECYYGDAPPDDGLKWTPLYTRPAPPPSPDLAQRVSDLERALVYSGFHQHGTPEHQLPPGIRLIDWHTVEVKIDDRWVSATYPRPTKGAKP